MEEIPESSNDDMNAYPAWLNWRPVPCFVLGLFLVGANAACALTQTRTPGTAANCISVAGIGTRSWSNPSRAIASDNSRASASVDGTTTRYLQCLNYGFTIPASATINGITASVERKSSRTSNGGSHDAAIRIVKGGAIGTTDRSTATIYTTSDVTEAHGSASDLWGLAWTAADINAASFGAAFAATKPLSAGNSHTISVDLIQITVDYTVDTTPPTVSSITRANGNPSGAATVSWAVVFTESVTGVDSGDFALVQAGGVSGASIASVTGSGTTWTVTANTGSGFGTLGLNLADNDTILDQTSNKLGGTGAGNGNFTGEIYTIDKLNPQVNSINRASADPTNAASVSWTVVLSESATGVDTGDFALAQAGGVSGASITSVTGSGTTWTVTANTGSGSGTLGLNLVDNDTIIDAVSRPLGGAGTGSIFTGQVFTIDKTIPSVISINLADPDPTVADSVTWTVVFNKSVSGVDMADFALAASGVSGAYITSATGSGATWTVSANTGIGSGTLGLNLVDNDSIIDLFSIPLGGAGANNGNFTGQAYTITDTPPMASYSMDEASWNGVVDEVADSQDGYPGTARNSATTTDGSRAIPGDPGTCRYGVFDNGGTITKGYIELPNFPDLDTDFTITAWVKATNNTVAGQHIFIDDESKTGGYGLSLGDGGTGKLRFYSRGSSAATLDTPNVIASNTWYFVAGVADIANGARKIYVYDAAGSLLPGMPVSAASAGWGTDAGMASIGAETNSSSQAPASFHFKGNLDEVSIYDKVLAQAALTALAAQKHACTTVMPDHLEIQHASGAGLTCAASTLTIRACADAACATPYIGGVSGTLSAAGAPAVSWDGTTGGATGAGFAIPAGGSSVTKNVQVATAGSVVFGITSPAPMPANATTCNFGACTFTANTAGFIFSSATTGSTYTIPAQVSGIAAPALYLRAVQASTTNPAVCTPAIISSTASVNMGYACNNPTTCQAGNLTSINATAIAGSPNSNPTQNSTSVSLAFDANGSTPITARYDDVGQITLYANTTVTPFTGGAAITLNGSSSAYVVAPHHFDLTGIQQTAAPNLVNPAAANATGAKFVKAGEQFSVTVTARNFLNAATPNYGKEATPESVKLTPALAAGLGLTRTGTIAGNFGAFANGVATGSSFTWDDVGIITLTPSVSDANYLGAGDVTGTASSNVGRFYAAQFGLSAASITNRADLVCPTCTWTYMGEQMNAVFTLTAQAVGGAATQNYNYSATAANNFARLDPTLAGNPLVFGAIDSAATRTPLTARLDTSLTATGNFVNGNGAANISAPLAITRSASADGPYSLLDIGIAPADTDGAKMAAYDLDTTNVVSTANDHTKVARTDVRYGRLKLSNAYGSELLSLSLTATAQYYTATGWANNITDNITPLTFAANYPVGTGTTAVTLTPATSTLAAGILTVNLAKPSGGATGKTTVNPAAPGYLPVTSGTATFGVYKGNNNFIYLRESY